jgi:hypothetical protein
MEQDKLKLEPTWKVWMANISISDPNDPALGILLDAGVDTDSDNYYCSIHVRGVWSTLYFTLTGRTKLNYISSAP